MMIGMFSPDWVARPPESAFEYLAESRYGFSRIDLQLFSEELEAFAAIDIRRDLDYDSLGDGASLEEEVALFLQAVGVTPSESIATAAASIAVIARKVLALSQREVAWFFLRALTPTSNYDIARWHIDGPYYLAVPSDRPQHKFVATLQGPSTIFYALSRQFQETRKVLWMHMSNRMLLSELFEADRIFSLERGEGAFFFGGNAKVGAFHSEPPIRENRLFFSIVPCRPEQLSDLKKRTVDNPNRHVPRFHQQMYTAST
jgi:hypothetical protein